MDLDPYQGPLNGGVSNGEVSRSGLVLPFLSFFVLFGTFPIFLGFSSGMVWGFSRFVLFLFLGLLRAPKRNSPEGSATQSGPFPKKVGNPRVWKPPGLASLNLKGPETPESSAKTHSGVNLVIEPKTKVGIMGSTGCGKSTLMSCCLRTLEPRKGKIEYDGVSI